MSSAETRSGEGSAWNFGNFWKPGTFREKFSQAWRGDDARQAPEAPWTKAAETPAEPAVTNFAENVTIKGKTGTYPLAQDPVSSVLDKSEILPMSGDNVIPIFSHDYFQQKRGNVFHYFVATENPNFGGVVMEKDLDEEVRGKNHNTKVPEGQIRYKDLVTGAVSNEVMSGYSSFLKKDFDIERSYEDIVARYNESVAKGMGVEKAYFSAMFGDDLDNLLRRADEHKRCAAGKAKAAEASAPRGPIITPPPAPVAGPESAAEPVTETAPAPEPVQAAVEPAPGASVAEPVATEPAPKTRKKETREEFLARKSSRNGKTSAGDVYTGINYILNNFNGREYRTEAQGERVRSELQEITLGIYTNDREEDLFLNAMFIEYNNGTADAPETNTESSKPLARLIKRYGAGLKPEFLGLGRKVRISRTGKIREKWDSMRSDYERLAEVYREKGYRTPYFHAARIVNNRLHRGKYGKDVEDFVFAGNKGLFRKAEKVQQN